MKPQPTHQALRTFRVPHWLPLLLLLLALPAAVQAQYTCATNDGTLTIVSYIGSGGDVDIPGSIGGLPVTSIGSDAFANRHDLTGVTIPSGVTSIGTQAFYGCDNLLRVSLPDTLTVLGSYAFENCLNLTGVTIPDGVTSIGTETFYGCENLSSLSLPDSVTALGERAFGHCGSLPRITLPGNLTSIGDYAFQRCIGLSEVILPGTLTNLGGSAFYRCTGLTSVTIPAGLRTIGPGPFTYCTNLMTITADPGNPNYSSVDGVLFNKNQTTLVQYPGAKRGHYTVPDGVTRIGPWSFSFCYSLTSVTLPTSLSTIGANAFECAADESTPTQTNLTVAWFLGNAPFVGTDAFDGEPFLTLYFRGSTTGWWGLNSLSNRPVTCWDYTPHYDYAVQNGTVTLLRYIDVGVNFTIPATMNGYPVTGIASGAYSGYASITNLNIPDSVTNIADWAFGSCRNLRAINVGPGNPAYSSVNGVLFNKNQTTLIQYPAGRTGPYTIPNGVTSIRPAAFDSCTGLTSIMAPASLTNCGDLAFYYCPSLTGAYFQGNAPAVAGRSFALADNLTAYYCAGTSGWDSTLGGRPTALWNPTMASPSPSSLVFSNLVVGQTYELQSSPDLMNWTPVQTFSAPQSTWTRPNAWDANNSGSSFFRLRVVPNF